MAIAATPAAAAIAGRDRSRRPSRHPRSKGTFAGASLGTEVTFDWASPKGTAIVAKIAKS